MQYNGQLWMEKNGLLYTYGKIWSLDGHQNLDKHKKIICTSMLGMKPNHPTYSQHCTH
jgi:hypothetical protein